MYYSGLVIRLVRIKIKVERLIKLISLVFILVVSLGINQRISKVLNLLSPWPCIAWLGRSLVTKTSRLLYRGSP
jgi:hypothetical protein